MHLVNIKPSWEISCSDHTTSFAVIGCVFVLSWVCFNPHIEFVTTYQILEQILEWSHQLWG